MKQKMKRGWSLFVAFLVWPAAAAWAQYGYGQGPFFDQGPGFWSRMGWHVVAAILGGIVGAFFSQKFRKYRRWIFLGFVGLGAVLAILLTNAWGHFVCFILAAGAAWFFLRDQVKKRLAVPKKPDTFGTAEWATLPHLGQNGLVGETGLRLGFFQSEGQRYPLHYAGERHLLTVAPTRAGKGVSAIIPNLLTYEGSAIVIDPKGENAKITFTRRGSGDHAIPGMGQNVHVVDPWGITGKPAARFNPMDWLNPEDEDISENAMILADSIVTPQGGFRDQFWDEEAKALLMGILLYVALDELEQGNRTLGRVRDIICLGNKGFKDIMLNMTASINPIISSTAERTLGKEEKLRSNVLASLQAHTHFLDSPRIRASLEASDFRFEDMKTTAMTVYLVLPADRLDTFGRWLRLLVQQAITVNARNIAIKPPKPILFMLDEMAALGRLSMVEQAFGLMAGFGMQLWGIVQDLSQLERIYEKGWETFIGNSGVLQYFGSRDHKTAEYFSKLCGVTTVEKFSVTEAVARAIGWARSHTLGEKGSSTSGTNEGVTHSESQTADIVQRHLAFPDELMVLRDNKQLLLIESFNPIDGRKVLWYQDDALKRLGADLKAAPAADTVPHTGPKIAALVKEKIEAPSPPEPARPEPEAEPQPAPVQEFQPVVLSQEEHQEILRQATKDAEIPQLEPDPEPERPEVVEPETPAEESVEENADEEKPRAALELQALLDYLGLTLACADAEDAAKSKKVYADAIRTHATVKGAVLVFKEGELVAVNPHGEVHMVNNILKMNEQAIGASLPAIKDYIATMDRAGLPNVREAQAAMRRG